MKIKIFLLWFIYALSFGTAVSDEIVNDIIQIDYSGALHWNGMKISSVKDSHIDKNGFTGVPIVCSENNVKGAAILKALDLLSDLGVLQVRFRQDDNLYNYHFPSSPQTTPWMSLAILPRKDAIKISNHVLRFKSYPDAVLVLVAVGKGTLSCDADESGTGIAALLRKLKNNYQLVAVGFVVQYNATYGDMMDALHSARLATISTYYFSDRTEAN